MTARLAVYRPYDISGGLLYVGISKDFGRRWRQHASTKQWWSEARRMTVEWYEDEAEALRAEVEAIECERPRYNVAQTNSHYRSARTSAPVSRQPYMGSSEIGREFGVSRQRVNQITAKPGFPEPYDVLSMGKIWQRAEVEKWARDHGRTPSA